MKGRKPKPTAIKKLQGNAGRRKLNDNEPSFPVSASVPAPAWLDEIGVLTWNWGLELMKAGRTWADVDLQALAKYCDVTSQWHKARAFISEKGQCYPLLDSQGEIRCFQQYPQVSIYRNLLNVMQKYETEFGWTPSSRSRLQVPGEEKPADPMEAFLSPAAFGAGQRAGEA